MDKVSKIKIEPSKLKVQLAYDYEKLFEVLISKKDETPILERNAFPYLIKNNSGKDIEYGNSGKVASGGYIVVQPSGEFHTTDPKLHQIDGSTFKNPFVNIDEKSAKKAADVTEAAFTKKEHVSFAIESLMKQNPDLKLEQLEHVGWAPSISKTIAFKIPDVADGRIIIQPWGKQFIDSKTEAMVAVVGNTPDCYSNSKKDFGLWSDVKDKSRSGDKLVSSLPEISIEDMAKALVPVKFTSAPLKAPVISLQ